MTLRQKEALAGIAFLAIPLIVFAVFYVIPFVITIGRTLWSDASWSTFVGFSFYGDLMGSAAFRLAALNTFKFIIVGVPLLMALSLGAAILLNMSIKSTDFFRSAFVLPLVLPTAAVAFVFSIIFDKGGSLNYILDRLGFEQVNFLNSSAAFWVMIILFIWKNMGFSIILMLSGLKQIPKDLYEAARLDGAGSLTLLRKITLPLMSPTSFFCNGHFYCRGV